MKEQTRKILLHRYAKGSEQSWEEICARVATHVSGGDISLLGEFYQMMSNMYFIPGGRILANAGTKIRNLANCFVLPVEDSRKDIYDSLGKAADVFAWGGGVGYNFSKLREKGALINSTGGKSSGVVTFMELFNSTGDIIQQASRRAAQMGILNVDHPDIEEFIRHKSTLNYKNYTLLEDATQRVNQELLNLAELGYSQKIQDQGILWRNLKRAMLESQLNYFNISVGITDKFMMAVTNDEDWNLISPSTGKTVKTVKARDLFRLIAKTAWETGDPGVVFLDRVNLDNMVPGYGRIESSNPCSEIFLFPYESCVLGSINLAKIYDKNIESKLDLEILEQAVRSGVRFLDKVHDVSYNNVKEINEVSRMFRRIGLGVMGWADLLVLMDIPYDSDEAESLAFELSWFINFFAWSESMRLADKYGAFPYAEEHQTELDFHIIDKVVHSETRGKFTEQEREKWGKNMYKVRNVAVTAIAPTGGLSLIAEVNSAIEPFFALGYKQYITEGEGTDVKEVVFHINPLLQDKLFDWGYEEHEINAILQIVEKAGSVQKIEWMNKLHRDILKTSHEIEPLRHILMQSAWQTYFSNAISKTINLPNDATVEEVEACFYEMWNTHCKGGTVYRDGSRNFQVFEV